MSCNTVQSPHTFLHHLAHKKQFKHNLLSLLTGKIALNYICKYILSVNLQHKYHLHYHFNHISLNQLAQNFISRAKGETK